jgi:hypothetical protein
MLPSYGLLSALALYCHLTSFAFAFEHCWRRDNIPTSMADCKAPIDMIPSSRVEFDGKEGAPLSFLLPDTAREPNIYFPAIFRAGTCTITAYRPRDHADEQVFMDPPQPEKPPTAMYFKAWPGIRQAADKVVKSCLPAEKTGFNSGDTKVDIKVEGVTRQYGVMVKGQKPQALGKPEAARARWRCHVYQLDANGKVVRTCLDPPSQPRPR